MTNEYDHTSQTAHDLVEPCNEVTIAHYALKGMLILALVGFFTFFCVFPVLIAHGVVHA